MIRNRIVALACSALLAPALFAQGSPRPDMASASAEEIIRAARSQGPDGLNANWLQKIMRQGNNQPRAKLDAIADSVTNAVIRVSKVRSDSSILYAMSTLSAFTLFGVKELPGTPYDGVTERLIRVAREGANGLDRVALHGLTRAPDYARALRYLRDVAADTSRLASSAMSALRDASVEMVDRPRPINEREQAKAVLRELFVSKSVKNELAAILMASIAKGYNWR